MIELGVVVPNGNRLLGQLGVVALAQGAEMAGAQSLWVQDHLALVTSSEDDYPYSSDHRPTWSNDEEFYEALATCAMMAAATVRCRIGTAVLVLPQRNLLEVAKMVATIDRLSGGRFDLGVGAGWSRAEFEALGYDFARRGRRMDEMIHALRLCWRGTPESYHGEEVRVPPHVHMFPTPVNVTGPPILIGGMSRRSLRRAAELGNGWLAVVPSPSEWDQETLGAQLRDVHAIARPSGMARLRSVVKVHATAGVAGELPNLVREARAMGFDAIAVEPPWALGLDAAFESIKECRLAADE